MYSLTLPDEIRTSLTKAALLLEKRDGVMYNRPYVAELMIKMGLETLEARSLQNGHALPPVFQTNPSPTIPFPPPDPTRPPLGPAPPSGPRGVPTHMVVFARDHVCAASNPMLLVELYAHYCQWVVADGKPRVTRTKFSKSLATLGFERCRQPEGSAFYCGLVGLPPLA